MSREMIFVREKYNGDLLLTAKEAVEKIDPNALLQGEKIYDEFCVDFYYVNEKKGRIYLCSCYKQGEKARLNEVRIFKEI